MVVVAASVIIGRATAPSTLAVPGTLSAEAGFARDMQTHHDQAVEMAMIMREQTTNDEIKSLAYDVATSQAQQSGQMFGWLAAWGLPQNSPREAMAWMADSGHTHNTESVGATAGVMPGMATQADIDRLQSLTGEDAEVLFLQLMIAHHRGGVDMAKAVVERSKHQVVTDLAQSIITAQTGEIEYMTSLLAERGVN
nr:DUF305 domain-containing protein [Lysinibacter cavernae]